MRKWASKGIYAIITACIVTSTVQAANYGLMVGVDNYSPSYGVTPLGSCVNDAIGLGTKLKTDSSRWPASNISTLTDASATKSAIQSQLSSFASSASSGDTVVYFHSSHGGSYGGYNSYLCTYDADYSDTALASDLDAFSSGVNVIIIIDACYSGGMYKEKDAEQENLAYHFATNVMSKLTSLRKAKGLNQKAGASIAWMTACDYDELCSAGTPYSVFAGYLIEGFSYADSNSDGSITFKELFDYAAPKASAVNPGQTAGTYNDSLLSSISASGEDVSGGSGGTGSTTTTPTTDSTDDSTTTTTGNSITIITTTTLPPERAEANDFTGDGCADFTVFDNSSGYWFSLTVSNEVAVWAVEWGWDGATPAAGDFNGDNQCDLAIFDSSSGNWYVCACNGEPLAFAVSTGTDGDIPVSGDYNGDKIDDFAVFDSDSGRWDAVTTDGEILIEEFYWGWAGAVPVSGDYNGDGKSDLAVFDDENGYWYIITTSGDVPVWGLQWGWAGAVPVPGDYDGDGIDDLAVYDSNNGYWYVLAVDGTLITWALQWGWTGADAISGDYDGDGKSDYAVYDSSGGYWFVLSSADNSVIVWGTQWGGSGATAISR